MRTKAGREPRARTKRRQDARDTKKVTRSRAFQMALLDEALPADEQGALIIDLFAGGGGASEGIRLALDRSPDVAVNHWQHAIDVHTINHPETHHYCTDVWDVKTKHHLPRGKVWLLWASPDCRHHSRAKGGKPVSEKIRGLAWVIPRVAEERRPAIIFTENVAEFLDWGPLGPDSKPIKERRGETFRKWVRQLEALGYVVEWRVLCAADYGTPTSRRRLFIIARCDGLPIVWPEPTHGPGRSLPWRTAAECIDWTVPMHSIFDRKKPLCEATCARIAEGIRRFVLNSKAPFLLDVDNDGNIVAPSLIQAGYGEREGQAPRVLDLGKPMGTVVAGGCKQALCAAFLQKHNGKTVGQPVSVPFHTLVSTNNKSLVAACLTRPDGPTIEARVDAPLTTVAGMVNHMHLVAPFLTRYFGSEKSGQRVDVPLSTVTTKDRHALVSLVINGETYVVTDILFRMLRPRELARGQGFSDDYQITGTDQQQVKLVGNSVCQQLAAALISANVAPQRRRVPAAAE